MNKVEIGDRVVLTPRWVAGLAQTLRRLGMDSDVSRIQGIQGTVTAVRGSFGSNRVSVWVLFDNASDGIAIPYPKTAVRKIWEDERADRYYGSKTR